jgi:hypothetical protein
MHYRTIIKEAWSFAQANKSMMKWYALVPSIFSTIAGVLFICYQYFSFRTQVGPDGQEHSVIYNFMLAIFDYFKTNPQSIWYLIIFGILAIIFYLFYPTFAQGAMIQLIARKKAGQDVKLVNGITYGLGSFLPMFEYHLAIRSFSLTAIITESTFVIRNLGSDFIGFLLPIFFLISIAGLFLTLFFTFVEWYIAIDDEGVFAAMQKSASLVFRNWQHTVLVLILLSVIVIRVIINMILVFLIPLVVFAGVGLIASVTFKAIAMSVAIVISLGTLYVAGYLGGTLSVFSHAVWTSVFLELSSKVDSAREAG